MGNNMNRKASDGLPKKPKKPEAPRPPEYEQISIAMSVVAKVVLTEPTPETNGFGLFLLSDGTVRWSTVTLNDGEKS